MISTPVLAVDLGGTKIRAGVVAGDRVTDQRSAPTPARLGASSVLDAVADLVARTLSAAAAQGQTPELLGVGSAGVIDPDSGLVISATDAFRGGRARISSTNSSAEHSCPFEWSMTCTHTPWARQLPVLPPPRAIRYSWRWARESEPGSSATATW
nr:ROK family protein [Kocuria atrinae]